MRKMLLAIAFTLPWLMCTHAIASESTAAMAPVHQLIDGFNSGDMKSAVAACADVASVIDDFPPGHRYHFLTRTITTPTDRDSTPVIH